MKLPVRNGKEAFLDTVDFEILIFKPEHKQPGGVQVGALREYLAEFGNVWVYDAGFRLPYYGGGRDPTGTGRDPGGQDWLSVAQDHARRLSASELLPEELRTQSAYMQDLPSPGRIFGAVDIDTNKERQVALAQQAHPGQWLQIQSGRDRLHDNPALYQLRDLVRFSLDFYASRYRLLALEGIEDERERESPSEKYDRALETLERNSSEIPPTVLKDVKREILDARKGAARQEANLDRRAALLAPLATAGMVALELNHEITRESRAFASIGERLRRVATKHAIPELREIAEELESAQSRLVAIQELFAPLIDEKDRDASTRLKVREIARHTTESMFRLMPGVQMTDLSGIPADLRFPLGSFAEWNALLQNVLSNAWNAMLSSQSLRLSFLGGRKPNGEEWLRISDSGQGLGVPLDRAARLFEPLERHVNIPEDKRSIAIGGQGLGLAIVRMIARRRNATVAFVEPEDGFATTFELSWMGEKR